MGLVAGWVIPLASQACACNAAASLLGRVGRVSGGQRMVESTHMHCSVHRGDLPGTTATWLHLRRPATVYYRKPGLCPAARGGEHLLEELRGTLLGGSCYWLCMGACLGSIHWCGWVCDSCAHQHFGLYHHHLLRPLRHQRLAHGCRQLLQTEPPGAAQQLGTACASCCTIPLCGAGGVWGCGGAFCVWFPCLTGRLACTLMGYDGADAVHQLRCKPVSFVACRAPVESMC